jgi:undecaprenol kinase
MKNHLRRHLKGYKYAAKGVNYTLQTQLNIWVQLCITTIALSLAYWLDFTLEQYLILVVTIGFVISAELFNTAIEEMVNLLSPEMQSQAGIVKDVAAGAVLVAAVVSALIGFLLFFPPLLAKLG